MKHTIVLTAIIILSLAVWLMLPSSVVKIIIADMWDLTEEVEEEFSRLLSNVTIADLEDLECFFCKALIRNIQSRAKKDEEKLISDVTRPLCSVAREWTSGLASVCNGLVSEFKVSTERYL